MKTGKRTKKRRRCRWSESRRRELIESYKPENQSKASYCREHRIPYGTFIKWLKKEETPKSAFAEVSVPRISGYALEVHLPGGVIIKANDMAALQPLLKEVSGC